MSSDEGTLGRLLTAVLAAAGVLLLAGLAPRPGAGDPAVEVARGADARPAPRSVTGKPAPPAPAEKGTVRAQTSRPERSAGAALGPMAGELEIDRRDGESLEQLCQRVYGSRGMASLVRRAGWTRGGEGGIKVPVARRARVGPGDTLSRLAARHCGSPARWPVLAALSGIEDPKHCVPGTELVLPAVMRLEVREGDSLSSLAVKAWGEADGAALLAKWNRLPADAALEPGRWIEIPLAGPLLDREAAGD